MTTTSQQPLDLADIRARTDATTPGPWVAITDNGRKTGIGIVGQAAKRGTGEAIAVFAGVGGNRAADAAFTAHARADVPDLVAEVERLRGELAMWRDDVSAQWHAECLRLQGEVERLTREQLNADIAASSQPEAGAR